MVLGTLVALLLNKLGTKMRLFTLVGLLLAWATPAVTATQVWQFLFDTQFGVVNWALVSTRVRPVRELLLAREPAVLLTLAAIIVVWGAIPFVALTLFAGLSQVPNEMYEAASLDGASAWTKFRRLTDPAAGPDLPDPGGAVDDLGLPGASRRSTSCRSPAASPVRPTCWASTPTGSASPATTSALGAAIGVVMVAMLPIVSLFYIRQMIKQIDEES